MNKQLSNVVDINAYRRKKEVELARNNTGDFLNIMFDIEPINQYMKKVLEEAEKEINDFCGMYPHEQ